MNNHKSSNPAVIFFCHGSRDPKWRDPFDQIARQFGQQYPTQRVEVAFLELMEPGLGDVIDKLAGEGESHIRVLPLFLAAGAHTRRDLPALIEQARQRWPQVQFTVAPALTDASPIRDAIVSWASLHSEQD